MQVTAEQIRVALQNNAPQSIGLTIQRFMSATMQPVAALTSRGWTDRGVIPLAQRPGSFLVEESKAVAEFLGSQLNYPMKQLWAWVTRLQGLDITVIKIGERIVAAGIGYFHAATHTWLSHLTRVRGGLQGSGLGKFLRYDQIHQLRQRLNIQPMHRFGTTLDDPIGTGPLQALSLSNDATAIDFQNKVYLKYMEWTQTGINAAQDAIAAIDAAMPRLDLLNTMNNQPVTALLFRDD